MPLILFPDPTLKVKLPVFVSEKTEESKHLLSKLILDMEHTMKFTGGIGLAANQVGSRIRLFVMGDSRYFINPVIESGTGEVEIQERCLSFPGVTVRDKRKADIVISHEDIEGNLLSWPLEGIDAIVAQHEVDHLNGITFFDYASNVKKNIIKRKMQKVMRQLKHYQQKKSRK